MRAGDMKCIGVCTKYVPGGNPPPALGGATICTGIRMLWGGLGAGVDCTEGTSRTGTEAGVTPIAGGGGTGGGRTTKGRG
eukprot:407358-Rhodomonas_salina.1